MIQSNDTANEQNNEHPSIARLRAHTQFFHRSLSCLEEADAFFRPQADMLTIVGQIHHVTAAIEFFLSGLLFARQQLPSLESIRQREFTSRRGRGEAWIGLSTGFSSMDWVEVSNRDIAPPGSDAPLSGALKAFDDTMEIAVLMFGVLTDDEMTVDLPANPLGFRTARDVMEILVDHTAHHRGAIAQYARILGREPQIPYFEMSEALHEAQLLTIPRESANATASDARSPP